MKLFINFSCILFIFRIVNHCVEQRAEKVITNTEITTRRSSSFFAHQSTGAVPEMQHYK